MENIHTLPNARIILSEVSNNQTYQHFKCKGTYCKRLHFVSSLFRFQENRIHRLNLCNWCNFVNYVSLKSKQMRVLIKNKNKYIYFSGLLLFFSFFFFEANMPNIAATIDMAVMNMYNSLFLSRTSAIVLT